MTLTDLNNREENITITRDSWDSQEITELKRLLAADSHEWFVSQSSYESYDQDGYSYGHGTSIERCTTFTRRKTPEEMVLEKLEDKNKQVM